MAMGQSLFMAITHYKQALDLSRLIKRFVAGVGVKGLWIGKEKHLIIVNIASYQVNTSC